MPDLHETINQFLEGSIASIGRDPVIESKSITANGTYTAPEGVDGYNPITVNVPTPTPVIESKSITANGTYTAPEGVDGYSPITVNVPTPTPVIESKSITANGTYTAPEGVDGYSPITVNVPLPSNAYLLKSVNTPTPIASFSDGEEMVMPTLKVAIEPQQEGSGDPSPTNVRPISGWTEEVVTRCGKNQAKKTIHGYINYQNSKMVIDNDSESVVFYAAAGKTYTVSSSVTMNRSMLGLADTDNIINQYQLLDIIELSNEVVTWTATWTGWTVWYKCTSAQSSFANSVQVELGSSASDFEPYADTTYTIDLDGTRYGGEVDVVNGIVTPAPYYASYNGETLTGEWISDRDKYEVGTTPTIGAQVVNIGASGTPVSILPTAIKSLRGVNNVYANTGDITDAEYFSKED